MCCYRPLIAGDGFLIATDDEMRELLRSKCPELASHTQYFGPDLRPIKLRKKRQRLSGGKKAGLKKRMKKKRKNDSGKKHRKS